MDYSSYDILQLPYSASKEQVESQYRTLRDKYQRDRFLIGAAGEEAAEKLQQIEVAYSDIMAQLNSYSKTNTNNYSESSYDSEFGNPFALAQQYVKDNNLDQAQTELDNCAIRNGEWHYIQSVVFYKRNWFLESKKQLEFACSMEPDNEKYKESLNKLNKILASNAISPDQLHTSNQSSSSGPSVGAGNGTCTGSSCTDCLMCNMCCNCAQCMGGC